jgi:integrase
MAKAKKLPSGSWRVQLYIGRDSAGKRKYKSFTAATKKEAEYQASKYALKRGSANEFTITVGEAMHRYIALKTGVLSPSTIRSYHAIKNMFPKLESVNINNLTTAQVQLAVSELSVTYSPKTVRNAHGFLMSAVRMFAPDINFKVTLPTKKPAAIQIPTKEQLQTLLDAAADDSPLYTAILLAAGVGLRRSEIAALTWQDYNTNRKTLSVNKAMVKTVNHEWVIKTTKTSSSTRLLRLPDFICNHLDTLPKDNERIVPLAPFAITYYFAKLLNKLGFNFRFHDLRHFYASLLLALGVPDKYAMARMGHASNNMLKNVYQHIMVDKESEIDNAINQQLNTFFS